jgi:alpha-D-xyloside xylohydrolase
MPVFVRAGSIVPTGPAIQHTKEGQNGPLTLHVYTGADGKFTLYEDDGVSRQYLNGAFSRIPIAYDDQTRTLTIGARQGRYPGMVAKRTIHIRWVSPERARALAFEGSDRTIAYDGSEQTVRMP